MILVLNPDILAAELENLVLVMNKFDLEHEFVQSSPNQIVIIKSDTDKLSSHIFNSLDGVSKVIKLNSPYPQTAQLKAQPIELPFGVIIGQESMPLLIAGPCSVENREQIRSISKQVKAAGAHALRGGAFKPRTNPYEFCGLGLEALKYLYEASRENQLPVISEVMSIEHTEQALEYIDVLQIGARNMYNYELLKFVGRTGKPILLKRGLSATISEFLQSAEYILAQGNAKVILCERGIRTYEGATRNTLDLSAIPVIKQLTSLPIIADPSHATGRRDLIRPMSRAAIAAGADGLIIEVHENPDKSYSDAKQAITPSTLSAIADDLQKLHNLFGPDMDTSVSENAHLKHYALTQPAVLK